MSKKAAKPNRKPVFKPKGGTGKKPVRPKGHRRKRALRVTVLHSLEFLALLMAIFLVLFGAVSWQLSKGPIALDAFTSDAERALLQVFGGDQASIGQLQADWSRKEKAVVIAATNVQITNLQGQEILNIPRFEAGLTGWSLLRGRLELTRLVAVGGEFSIVRREDGAIGIGAGSVQQVLDNARVWAQGTPGQGVNAPLIRRAVSNLQVLTIRQSAVNLEDFRSGVTWRAPDTELSFRRSGHRLEFSAHGLIESKGQQSPVQLNGTSRDDFSMLAATASFENVIPAQLVPDVGPLATLHQLDAPVSASISVATDEDGLLTHADFELKASAGTVQLGNREIKLNIGEVQASYNAATGTIQLDQVLLDGEQNHLEATGTIRGLDPARLVVGETIEFDLDFAPSKLDFTGFMPGVTAIDDLQVKGSFLSEERELNFQRWSIAAHDLAFSGTANVKWVQLADKDGWFQRTNVTGRSSGQASFWEILSFWPVDTAEGVRTWAKNNFRGANLRDFVMELKVDERVLTEGGLTDDMLTLSFAFDDLETTYYGTMPPLREASGTALLRGNRFDVDMQSGKLLQSDLTEGFVEVPFLHPIGAIAIYGAKAMGPLSDLLTLLDQKPFGYASMYKIVPSSISGVGEVDFQLRRAMRTTVPWRDLGFSAKGAYHNVSAPGLVMDQDLSDVRLTFEADQTGLEVKGKGMIGDWPSSYEWRENFRAGNDPRTSLLIETRVDSGLFDGFGLPTRDYFSGDIGLKLEMIGNGLAVQQGRVDADLTDASVDLPGPGWEKPIGKPGSLRFQVVEQARQEYKLENLQLTAEGLGIEGDLVFSGQSGLQSLNISKAKLEGAFDLTASVVRDDQGGFVLQADVDEADISTLVRGLVGRGGQPTGVPLQADIKFKRVVAGDRLSFSEGHFEFKQSLQRIEWLNFTATSPEGEHQFHIVADANGNGRIDGVSPDGGSVLQAFYGVDGLVGGSFTVAGLMSSDEDLPSKFVLNMQDFHLTNTPVVAKILSLGSLRGFSDTMSGSGMLFNTMEVPVLTHDGLMQIRGARATGPAMGVTMDGDVDLVGKTLKMQGTIAPAYTLNSILGAVPVLGDILVPREGEGIFGLTYAVDGPYDEMQVSVNPLSAFTPGVLRQMFGSDLPEGLEQKALENNKAPDSEPATILEPETIGEE
jgi:hypothetical protein